jgi:signal transduction histidine kinase
MSDKTLAEKAIGKAFPGIPKKALESMILAGKVVDYQKETCLCLEGAVESTFYILLDGEVKVTKKINSIDDRLLKHLHPGDFFGEMGLIHDAPRAATVTTLGRVKVLEIGKESFSDTLENISTVSLAMVKEVSRRLRENDELAIEDLRQKAGELAEAYQKLAELDLARREFLTTIAHELRTPLTAANGFVQMIQAGMVKGEALTQSLEMVSNNLDRIIGLTNDILFLQEMDLIFSDFEPVGISNLMAEVFASEQNHAAEMGVNLRMKGIDRSVAVQGDRKSLERAFRAIINNAVKFSLGGGDVTVKLDVRGEMVYLLAIDQGIGIPEENLEQIFERFWRTESYEGHLFGGVGLGLAIARQVIAEHGGEIVVTSSPGVGSVFEVALPVAKHVPQE